MLRAALAGAAALVLVGSLAACDAVPMPVPSPSYTSSYVAPPVTTLAPLTGVALQEGQTLGPSLAAKIDNHVDARPQVGLEHTDLVFEELVEGGLTRYVAVWQSDVPAEIGPIRSIRPMDPDIISPLGGIVAYSGGQQRFVAAMKATNVYNAIHGQSDTADVMFRTNTKRAPHNVLVRAPQLIAKHADLKPPGQQFSFAIDVSGSTAVRDGAPVTKIALRFGAPSTPSWAFDAASGRYLRSQGWRRRQGRSTGAAALGGERAGGPGAGLERRRGAEDRAGRFGRGLDLVRRRDGARPRGERPPPTLSG